MTPLLGFTKLKEKLLDGTKTQTIRKPRKHPIKVGDKLYIYWKLRTKECQKLGEGIVTKIVRKKLYEINNEDAKKDGFESIGHLNALGSFLSAFLLMHPNITDATEFDIITWKWIK